MYFVLGNVIVFYPNIDVQKAHQIVSDYLIDYCDSFGGEFDLDWGEWDVTDIYMFKKALFIANKNLLYQFDGKIASSPDLVNLYSCFFENKVDIYLYPDITFYGRYINNCLSLVYTKNKWSVKCLLENLVMFNNCIIEWSASDSYITFLDMTLFS